MGFQTFGNYHNSCLARTGSYHLSALWLEFKHSIASTNWREERIKGRVHFRREFRLYSLFNSRAKQNACMRSLSHFYEPKYAREEADGWIKMVLPISWSSSFKDCWILPISDLYFICMSVYYCIIYMNLFVFFSFHFLLSRLFDFFYNVSLLCNKHRMKNLILNKTFIIASG